VRVSEEVCSARGSAPSGCGEALQAPGGGGAGARATRVSPRWAVREHLVRRLSARDPVPLPWGKGRGLHLSFSHRV
jgi:hypothetical protein